VADVAPLHPSTARFAGGLREVAAGVHAWLQPNGSWGESNAGLVAGDGASLLVDTLWDVRLTARMLAAMRPLVEHAPITTVVNTHSDGDHWWGNQLVADAEIVATEAAAKVMAGLSPHEMERFGRVGAALRLAGRVPLRYPRRDDVVTIGRFVGEVLGPFHYGDVRPTGPSRSFRGEPALDGPVCGIAEIERLADYWRWLEAAARRRLSGGASAGAVARELVLGDEIAARGFTEWLDPERAVISVRTIDAHRRGALRPPTPRDFVDAFARMALLARDRRPPAAP